MIPKSPERIAYEKEYRKNWRLAHPEALKRYAKTAARKHKTKILAYRRKWREREVSKDYELRTAFGIGIKDYKEMLDVQNNVCAICKEPQNMGKKNLAVDHDHSNGEIRGLLCNRCNMVLGLVKENTNILMDMAAYLIYHSEQKELV